jgi:hypothetical protein
MIALDSLDVGQLLDGLRAREESWRKTAEYLETGYSAEDSFICEKCHDLHEAEKIAQHYGKITSRFSNKWNRKGLLILLCTIRRLPRFP